MNAGFAAIAAKCRTSFERQGLMTHIGARMVRLEPGECDLECGFQAALSQQNGFFHAGATSSLADSAAGYAALSVFEPEADILTIEFKINLLAPAKGDRLSACGRVRRAGRTVAVSAADVWALEGDRRTLVATGLFTLMKIFA